MDICVWNKCNNKCIMCTNPEGSWEAWDGSFNYDYQSLSERVLKDRRLFEKDDTIYLTGGEPTIHPDFIKFINFLSAEFIDKKIILLTNGRRFYYEEFAKEFLDLSRNIEIHVSLYGHSKEVHEEITQAKGSYEQSRAGIINLLKHKKNGQKVVIRHVLSSVSFKHVKEFLKFVNKNFNSIDSVILMFWEIEAQAEKNLDRLKLKYSEVKPFLEEINDFYGEFKDLRLYHFPLCQISHKLWPIVWRTWPDYEVDFISECKKCKVKKHCVGIHKAYLENIGSEEFKALDSDHKLIVSKNRYKPINFTDN